MPELTTIHFGLLALMLVVGVVLGWIFRSDRSTRDKIAITASWQEQIESQYSEQSRLAEQNKSLMGQISQYQVTNTESAERTDELSIGLREAVELRDELQQQLKENDENLQAMTEQRDRLRGAIENRESQVERAKNHLKQKDERILRLNRDLDSWHSRVPPLVEKFKARNLEAINLESELQIARETIERLEELSLSIPDGTEPGNSAALSIGLDASNEPHDDAQAQFTAGSQDQIQDAGDGHEETAEEPDAEGELTGADSASPAADEPAEGAVDHAAETENGEDDRIPVEREVHDDTSEVSDDNDDLQQIKGIGPAIEKKLNDLGVCRFNQIAEMNEYEIDRVAQQLKGFRSRIYREDWLGQARDLHYKKYKSLP